MIRVANAPCSWGVIENVEGERGGYARVLDEMHEAGYAGTELGDWGFMPTDPRALRRELDSRQLKLLASWVSVHLHDPSRLGADEADVLRTARQLAEVGGPDNLVVLGNDPYTDALRTLMAGRILPEHGMNEAQWRTFADSANRIARTVKKETGLRTVFHHHIGTWVETPEETARFLSMTDPEEEAMQSRASGGMQTGSGTSTSRTTTRRSRRGRGARAGMPSSRSRTASSASSARATWTSRASPPSSCAAATAAGSWWSRTCCRGWEVQKKAPAATAST